MIKLAVVHPRFRRRRLEVMVPGLFSEARLIVGGTEAVGKKRRYRVADDGGQEVDIVLKPTIFDAAPALEIGGEKVTYARPLSLAEKVATLSPLVLLIGGAIGGAAGALGAIVNGRLMRSVDSPVKYGLAALVIGGAAVLYLVLAGIFHMMIGGPASR